MGAPVLLNLLLGGLPGVRCHLDGLDFLVDVLSNDNLAVLLLCAGRWSHQLLTHVLDLRCGAA
jgi:hypothetical protein